MSTSSKNPLRNQIIDTSKYVYQNVKDNFSVHFLASIIIITLIVCIYLYMNKFDNIHNCRTLTKVYGPLCSSDPNKCTRPPLRSITDSTDNTLLLRDYYIKTAYNCCCGGNFQNDYVNLCALENCIQQGARCLHFEIYAMRTDNDAFNSAPIQPVIAASAQDSVYWKGTFNYLKLDDVFTTITNQAFSNHYCANYNDPLILYFQIKSNHIGIYNIISDALSHYFNQYLLDSTYSDEYSGHNFGQVPIKTFKRKILIFVDGSNKLYLKSRLKEQVNMASSGPFLYNLKYSAVEHTQDHNLKDHNKKYMSIVLPDWNVHDVNPNFNIAQQYGCQLVGMSFQNYDTNLELYNEFFDGQKYAFVEKPAALRYQPTTVTIAPPNPKDMGHQSKSFSTGVPGTPPLMI